MSVTFDTLIDAARLDKWLVLENINKEQILEIGTKLGKPFPSRPGREIIDVIRPKKEAEAPKNSLSYNYGYNQIPLHTDGAYLELPPKFIILYFEGDCDPCVTTKLLSMEQTLGTTLRDEYFYHLFCIKSKKSFYESILNMNEQGEEYLRFNQDCMLPTTPASTMILKDFVSKIQKSPAVIDIPFKNKQMIIINNWNVLHGRSSIPDNIKFERTIYRAFVN